MTLNNENEFYLQSGLTARRLAEYEEVSRNLGIPVEHNGIRITASDQVCPLKSETEEKVVFEEKGSGNRKHNTYITDGQRFAKVAAQGAVHDKDDGAIALDSFGKLIKNTGVPGKDRRKMVEEYERLLFGGTAREQIQAAMQISTVVDTLQAPIRKLRQTY